jgi:NosR/NirI family nitrous oxide reductase transcriptional regulator
MAETAMVANRREVRKRQNARERSVTVAALLVLILAWYYGYAHNGSDYLPLVTSVLPNVARVETHGAVFYGYDQSGDLVGYAGVDSATGYGGPIDMMVGVDPEGTVIGARVVEHRETPGFFRRLADNDYFAQFLDKGYADSFSLGEGVDAVTGATVSSEAVARAIGDEVRALGAGPIGAKVPPVSQPIQVGAPEFVLIGLFVAGYFGHRSRHKTFTKWMRRGTLAAGVILIGFVYNKPLTVAHFISLLAGYWPDWHVNLYWFLLLGGILFVTTAQGKNPYCSWFCPFGAVQEGLGRIAGAKLYMPKRLFKPLQWAQRGLAFTAIALGLALRQPSAASYEPFGTLFDFNGSTPQWILLALVLPASMLFYRPFCNYVCPMNPIVDYIGSGRRWAQSLWRKRGPR